MSRPAAAGSPGVSDIMRRRENFCRDLSPTIAPAIGAILKTSETTM